MLWLPETGDHWNAIFWGLLLAALTLPGCPLLLRLPLLRTLQPGPDGCIRRVHLPLRRRPSCRFSIRCCLPLLWRLLRLLLLRRLPSGRSSLLRMVLLRGSVVYAVPSSTRFPCC